MTSIKTKLLTLTTVCVLSTSLIISSLAIFHLSVISRENAEASLDLTRIAEKERLDTIIQNIRHVVHSMRDVIISDVKDVDDLIKDPQERVRLTRYFEELNYTLCYNTDGATAFYFRYNPLFFTDGDLGYYWAKGRRSSMFSEGNLPDISPETIGSDQSVWYYNPVNKGRPSWIQPYFGDNNNILISYVIPLYVKGTLLGVVGMDIDFSIIINEIESVELFKTGFAYLTDENNKIIYHREYETGDQFQENPKMETRTISLSNDWILSVTAPIKEMNYERNRLIILTFLVTLFIAFIFTLVARRFTFHIINPLLELTTAAHQIANGDLNAHITCTTNDEIGQLANTFRTTLDRLPEYMYRDSLTGIRNANAYKKFISTLDNRVKSNENFDFGLLVLDVNNLKQMNDKFGHEAGDQLLIHATRLICRIFAHSPVFRIGGDEFVVYLESEDLEDITNLLDIFDNGEPTFKMKNKTFLISIARGFAIYDREKDSEYELLFHRADQAMYANKKAIKEKLATL